MEITRNIVVREIDLSSQNICAYWEDRNVKFIERSKTYLIGKRGSWLGNLFSFNMKKIISTIEISQKPQVIECKLTVNTLGQYITESNRHFFYLELESFEKYLLLGESNEAAWITQRRQSKQDDISFLLGCFFIGLFIPTLIFLFF